MRNGLKIVLFFLVIVSFFCLVSLLSNEREDVEWYEVSINEVDVHLFWKDEKNTLFRSIGRLKDWLDLRNKELLFAMNGGMYTSENNPQGLFIERGISIKPMDTGNGIGNFYIRPNGVFCITKEHKALVCQSSELPNIESIRYATQSGPMLVVHSEINKLFNKKSNNLNVRNGVGILPNGNLLFAKSKKEITFFDFATFFKDKGCENALYLDGFVSRMYLPSKNVKQLDGNFGVIIGVLKR